MSVVYITDHDENIYNITKSITQKKQAKKSPRLFKSRFKQPSQEQKSRSAATQHVQLLHLFSLDGAKRCVKKHATMGVPEEEPPDPRNYLKKHTGKPSYSACQPDKDKKPSSSTKEYRKAKTPNTKELLESRKEAAKKCSNQDEKDFVKENIETVKCMKPKEHPPRVVIDRKGDKIKPIESGLEPIYIHQKVFGRTPNYLVRFNRIREKEYQMKKDATGVQQPKCRYITRDEREQLLNGLKQNWEELQKQYQGLPILTDTIPKKIRKSKLEADLKQLEKDVVLIERHPYIYVYDDRDSGGNSN